MFKQLFIIFIGIGIAGIFGFSASSEKLTANTNQQQPNFEMQLFTIKAIAVAVMAKKWMHL